MMALTRSFNDTVRARAQRDPDFRLALIREAVEKLVGGDVEAGLSILGNYVNATIGYKTLAERTGKNPKSLMRMLGPAGNPTAENLFSVIKQLKEQEGLEFEIRARQARSKRQRYGQERVSRANLQIPPGVPRKQVAP